jgi:hypothetical protein
MIPKTMPEYQVTDWDGLDASLTTWEGEGGAVLTCPRFLYQV